MANYTHIVDIESFLLPNRAVMQLLEFVDDQQATQSLLFNSGISPEDLEKDDGLVSYRQATQVITNTYQFTGCETLGLEVGGRLNIMDAGILGYAMLNSATMGEVLAIGCKYYRIAQTMMEIKVVEKEEGLCLQGVVPFDLPEIFHRYVVEKFFSGVQYVLSQVCGQPIELLEFRCTYSKPEYVERYQLAFNCPVVFDSSVNELVFPVSTADIKVPQANRHNASMSEKICQDILSVYVPEDSLSMRVKQCLVRSGREFPGEETVAKEMNMASRTMRRLLREEDTNFREIVKSVRCDLAKEYLLKSELTVEQIAHLLGYVESTNFRRAFKKWMGVSPREFRNINSKVR